MKNELRLFCRLIQTGGFALFLKNRPRRYDKSAALVPRGKSAGPGASGWKLFRFPPPLTQLKFNFSLLFLQSFLLKKKEKTKKQNKTKKKRKRKKQKTESRLGREEKEGASQECCRHVSTQPPSFIVLWFPCAHSSQDSLLGKAQRRYTALESGGNPVKSRYFYLN